MSNSDDLNHDPDYKYFDAGRLDGSDTTYAGENIAYNHRGNFGDKWGVYGTSKNPMQAVDTLFDQWKNSPSYDKSVLAQNNVVDIGVHIVRHGDFTRIYGTQRFYAVTDGPPSVLRFRTTGGIASAYGFDGVALNTSNTNYVSGLAGGGDVQRIGSWQNKVGSLPDVALPVDVSGLPANAGSAMPAISASASTDIAPSVERQQAVIDTQASVSTAQAALGEYLASAEERKPVTSLVDVDVKLDRVAGSITSQTVAHLEEDGDVTLQDSENAGRYLTTTEYRDVLTRYTTLSVGQNGNNLSVGDRVDSTPDQQAPSDGALAFANGDKDPSVGRELGQTPASSVPSAALSAPANGGSDPASEPSAPANGDGNSSVTPSAPASGDTTSAAPETSIPIDDQGVMIARLDITLSANPTRASVPVTQGASTPTQARTDALAATSVSFVWVGVGVVAVLVTGAGVVVTSC